MSKTKTTIDDPYLSVIGTSKSSLFDLSLPMQKHLKEERRLFDFQRE